MPATSTFGKEDMGKWPFRPYIQMLANNSVSASNVVTDVIIVLERVSLIEISSANLTFSTSLSELYSTNYIFL